MRACDLVNEALAGFADEYPHALALPLDLSRHGRRVGHHAVVRDLGPRHHADGRAAGRVLLSSGGYDGCCAALTCGNPS